MKNYVANSRDVALVCRDMPLLRELSAVENLSLILEYHENISIVESEKIVSKLFEKCGMGYIRDKRVYEIDRVDIVALKYLRAYISSFPNIMFVQPLSMLDKMEDMGKLFELFNLLNDKMVLIADLKSNSYYKDMDVIQ